MRLLIALFFLITSATAKPIKIYLDWFVNPHHAALVVAQQAGIFDKHGLQVTLIAAGGSEEGSRQVAAGAADFAISKQSAHLIRCCNQDMPLVRIATLINKPLECLIASEEITSLSDLKGKRIGYTSSSVEFAHLSLATMLAKVGLKLTDVTLVPITSGMVSAFMTKNVDALLSAYRTYELDDIRQYRPNVKTFYYEENGIPSYDQVIVVANRAHLEDAKKLVAALQESVDLIHYSPEQAWSYYTKGAPEQNTPQNKMVFMTVANLLVQDIGYLPLQRYNEFAAFVMASGILKAEIPQGYAVDGAS
ncbi:ABC transporter substrate-binding protein [Candidatus Odyssella acanthamoebae]|uniref:ABC transporter substrate-binding protein n=1 Tax=Candidatus Odyssella acanthamoebae TaxID=91604 RepID=UPI00068AFBE0|nr:ABC transporter substrate-binding protein [Candidatus Paracaedibacter acanthamoebae]